MQNFDSTFELVLSKWSWKPIRDCPGRFTFFAGVSELTLAEICGVDHQVLEFSPKEIADQVSVIKFDDGGGLISYRKSANGFLHTLNDAEGFARKLNQLNVVLPS